MTKNDLSRIAVLGAAVFLFFAFAPNRISAPISSSNADTLSRNKISFEKQVSDEELAEFQNISFPSSFNAVEGVTTFRGGPYRDKASHGVLEARPKSLVIKWFFSTTFDKSWGGGSGWTGQPLVIKWPDSTRKKMNLNPASKAKTDFTEVIIGSLDGKIYFIDLETGKASRPAINIQNPIKGTLSVDPRGWPLLYAGQGISNTGEFGVRIFSLTDQKKRQILRWKILSYQSICCSKS